MDICHSFHNFGSSYGTATGGRLGTKARMAEYQAAILLAQMERLEEQTARRMENATYLTSKLKPIPGIVPHKLNDASRELPTICTPSGICRSNSAACRGANSSEPSPQRV